MNLSDIQNKYKNPLKIGNYQLPSRVLPAPMAGLSHRGFRDFLREFGCRIVYTEMVNAEGLIRGKQKSWRHVGMDDEPPPVVVQIYGKSAEAMAHAAKMVEDYGAVMIDLNLGCPARKIVRNDSGSALLAKPDFLQTVFSSIRKMIKVPFTIKMRSGIGDKPMACFEIAKIAESEGVDAITLHPRTREQFYSGHSDWNQITEMKSIVKIPVIGNGDIKTPQDAFKMASETNCDAVMIGRSLMGNPWLIKNTSILLESDTKFDDLPLHNGDDIIEAIKIHYKIMLGYKPEISALREMRKFVIHYFKGFQGLKDLRMRWMTADKYEDVEQLLSDDVILKQI